MNRNVKHKRRQAGFSLVELMVVVSIMSVLLAIAGYNYAGWAKRQKVEAFTRSLQAAVSEARMSALQTSTTHCFYLSTPTTAGKLYKTMYAVGRDTNGDSVCDQTITYGNVQPGTTNKPFESFYVRNATIATPVEGAQTQEFNLNTRGLLVDTSGNLLSSITFKVDYPGECAFTGECPTVVDCGTYPRKCPRTVYPDVDCLVITPTQVNVGLGGMTASSNNAWDGTCHVK